MHSMQGYADALHRVRVFMRTVHSMQWYACRQRPGSVCNYEEDTVSKDDENDRFKRAHEIPKGFLAPQAARDSLQYRDSDMGDVT